MKYLLFLLMVVVLVGCGSIPETTIAKIPNEELSPIEIDQKEYAIGKAKTVRVGFEMMARKKFNLRRWVDKTRVIIDRDCKFELKGAAGFLLIGDELILFILNLFSLIC